MTALTESVNEDSMLEWFEALGYALVAKLSFCLGEPAQERSSYADVVLEGKERFLSWRTMEGEALASQTTVQQSLLNSDLWVGDVPPSRCSR